MKTYRTTRGPFNERPHFEDREIEAMCIEELRKVDLLPATPSPIRIERFIEKRFKVSVEPAELKDGVLGFTEFGANGVSGDYLLPPKQVGGAGASNNRGVKPPDLNDIKPGIGGDTRLQILEAIRSSIPQQ